MRFLTLLTFSAAVAFAAIACSDDDSGKPGTTTGSTTSTTGSTTSSTTSSTTASTTGTTSGNGSLTIAGVTSTAVVTCQTDAQNLIIDGTAANANTCNIMLGSQPTATSSYTIINGGQTGSAAAGEAIIICRNNNGLNAFYSTGGTLQVTVNGAGKQVSFSNITMRSLDDTTVTISSSAVLNCP